MVLYRTGNLGGTAELFPFQIERVRSNLKSMDDGLAPYPYETYRTWFSLSSHITGIARVLNFVKSTRLFRKK